MDKIAVLILKSFRHRRGQDFAQSLHQIRHRQETLLDRDSHPENR